VLLVLLPHSQLITLLSLVVVALAVVKTRVNLAVVVVLVVIGQMLSVKLLVATHLPNQPLPQNQELATQLQ
jgi:hypothetical protein